MEESKSETTVPTPRECGDCAMCCKVMAVAAVDKPPGTWCRHCTTRNGCDIYEDRPEQCRTWTCMWQLGLLPEELSPRKTKLVFWIAGQAPDTKIVVQGDPTFPHAHLVPKVNAFLHSLGKQIPTFIINGSRRTAFGQKAVGMLKDAVKTAEDSAA